MNDQPKPDLDGLKRQAKQLKKATPGMKHHEALDHVAHDHGYIDWRHARAELAPDEEEECA